MQRLRFGVRYSQSGYLRGPEFVKVPDHRVIMTKTTNDTPPRPMFSERHYKAIAAVLAATDQGYLTPHTHKYTVEVISSLLANIFEADNPRFSAPLFMAATRKKIDGASSH